MVRSDEISITAAPLSDTLKPPRRKSSPDAGTRRSRLRMRLGKGSLPVRVENSPTVTLTRLSTAATEMSDKVITCIPGSSNGTATAYPQGYEAVSLGLRGTPPSTSHANLVMPGRLQLRLMHTTTGVPEVHRAERAIGRLNRKIDPGFLY